MASKILLEDFSCKLYQEGKVPEPSNISYKNRTTIVFFTGTLYFQKEEKTLFYDGNGSVLLTILDKTSIFQIKMFTEDFKL